jgi:hypothetical protein
MNIEFVKAMIYMILEQLKNPRHEIGCSDAGPEKISSS